VTSGERSRGDKIEDEYSDSAALILVDGSEVFLVVAVSTDGPESADGPPVSSAAAAATRSGSPGDGAGWVVVVSIAPVLGEGKE
jgi:hypothetical protein